MAEEEQAQEKTEDPSSKRLKESREKGQVARSKDFNALVILLGAAASFYLIGARMASDLGQAMRQAFSFEREWLVTPMTTLEQTAHIAWSGLLSMVPLLIVIMIFSVIGSLLVGGWVMSGETLAPKFSRMSPLKGLKRMVSLRGLVEMLKSFLKFLLVGGVAYLTLKWQLPALFALAHTALEVAVIQGLYLILQSFLIISSSLILVAALDVPFQMHEHSKQLKMSKQELKDEYKETEGKPEVKGHIRRTQQDMARRRMMTEVPKASVILTNPTHYAVAIRYDQKGKRAPIVIAKGKDLIALQIRQLGKASGVPVLNLPPLTRAIYFSTKLNADIPRPLYVAVAQVLAYVYQLKNKQDYDERPSHLEEVPIPADLQRPAEE